MFKIHRKHCLSRQLEKNRLLNQKKEIQSRCNDVNTEKIKEI